MIQRVIVAAFAAGILCVAPSCDKKSESGGTAQTGASDRCPHEIKAEKCPFCTPTLIESEGFCGEHGVAEALCVVCRPYLKPVFRTQGDWCEEHGTADSQCVACHPELKEKIRPGEHGVSTPTGQG